MREIFAAMLLYEQRGAEQQFGMQSSQGCKRHELTQGTTAPLLR